MKKLTTLTLMVLICGAVWGQCDCSNGIKVFGSGEADANLVGDVLKVWRTGYTTVNRPNDFTSILHIGVNSNSDFQIASYYGGASNAFWLRSRNDLSGKWKSWDRLITNKYAEFDVLAKFNSGISVIEYQSDANSVNDAIKVWRTGYTTANRPNDFTSILHIGVNSNSDFQIASYYGGASNAFWLRSRNDLSGKWKSWDRILTNKYAKVDTDLTVHGSIKAHEIEVTLATMQDLQLNGTLAANNITYTANGNTADFVFEDNYHLKDLAEVEAFIKTNKHLPEIPSATDMEEAGVNLAEMNKLLLMKVEELTLYAIEQKAEAEKNEAEVTKVRREMEKSVSGLELKVEELTEDRRQETEEMKERLAKMESLLEELIKQ